ncbi:MAG: imidazole glycerol phosphate synthase subunit HisH [Chitinivibrionales bacterium]|nr:imidazole glycerol phosphate synthase subunit HisH [Chitinivibrionales bacterium]
MTAIIDYNAGNLTSVKRALDYLGISCVITPDRNDVLAAERILFPGVGHAGTSMQILRERGLDTALREAYSAGTPILGICLGTQIILSHSDEGDTSCVGLIDGDCPRFAVQNNSLKIPHMGWDGISIKRDHPLLRHVTENDEFYFVHSYYPRPGREEDIIAECEYEALFPAVIGCKNLFATQFHPEKSGRAGLELLKNFCAWDGAE